MVSVKPRSPASDAGIFDGDMIVEIDGIPVFNMTHKQILQLLGGAGEDFTVIVARC